MKDLGSIMKQAQLMQERLADAQNKLAAMSMVGTSGGGMVKVRLSGTNVLEAVEIDPSLMEPGEAEMLADLLDDEKLRGVTRAVGADGAGIGGVERPAGRAGLHPVARVCQGLRQGP